MATREPIFNLPPVVTAVAAIFFAIHGIRSFLPDDLDLWLLLTLSFIPARYSGSDVAIPGGEIATLTSPVTFNLIHGDITHLLINTVWLLAFGSAIAIRAGTFRFLFFSLLCGLGGAAAHLAAYWGSIIPALGASAAISGLMAGAMRFFFAAARAGRFRDLHKDPKNIALMSLSDTFKDPRFLLFIGVWVGLNVLLGQGVVDIGEGQTIAWEAHIGGFLTGLLTYHWFDMDAVAVNEEQDY